MPVTATLRPPRNGPMRRHFIPFHSDSGTFAADAAAATKRTRPAMRVRIEFTSMLLPVDRRFRHSMRENGGGGKGERRAYWNAAPGGRPRGDHWRCVAGVR